MRSVLFAFLLLAAPLYGLTPNLPAGSLLPGMIVQTRFGPIDCILNAPSPQIPDAKKWTSARGVYAIDLSVATGWPYTVRVLESSGDTARDNIVVETLRNWRFKPRTIYKLVIPIDFRGAHTLLGGQR